MRRRSLCLNSYEVGLKGVIVFVLLAFLSTSWSFPSLLTSRIPFSTIEAKSKKLTRKKETFLLFAQPIPSSDLGFVDRKATNLTIEVAGREFDVSQAPGVLESRRAGGTTGAVLWNVTPRLAEWLSAPHNALFAAVRPSPAVLELGCGTSGLLALVTAGRAGRYTLTDQGYVYRTLAANLAANEERVAQRRGKGRDRASSSQKAERREGTFGAAGNISFVELDWEQDVPGPSLAGGAANGLDVVLAADCIYNEALVRPFVQTCADACGLRRAGDGEDPTVCVVAQQLREPGVFGAWMEAFHERFRTWRVPDAVVGEELGEGSGFVVHVGVLR